MHHTPLLVICAFIIFAGCSSVGSNRTVVERTGPEQLLKLRSGPGLGFNIIMGLPDGTELNLRDCVTEVGQRWCQVSLADAPQVTGYVSADYLSGQ
ncbi:SH3 domain-containing protein [Yoonia sp. GPGPB17]|uniref:SH3 domain-containing protein n=1 Tax=Yoonia sp. GPGPB17 TaxID=3026147 RepID=UPI0030BCE085